MNMSRTALAYLLLAIAPVLGAQQTRGVIDALVTDTNFVPLANVEATVGGSNLRVMTGSNGRFRFVDLPAGQYVLAVRRDGFAASTIEVQVTPGDTARLSLTLQPNQPTLDIAASGLDVIAARRATFELHRAHARGQFMTETEIAARGATRTRQVLGGFSDMQVQAGLATAIDLPNHGRSCLLDLFVDGEPLKTSMVDRLPPPEQLLGIEVYARAQTVPPEVPMLQTGSCGAVLVWTKART